MTGSSYPTENYTCWQNWESGNPCQLHIANKHDGF